MIQAAFASAPDMLAAITREESCELLEQVRALQATSAGHAFNLGRYGTARGWMVAKDGGVVEFYCTHGMPGMPAGVALGGLTAGQPVVIEKLIKAPGRATVRFMMISLTMVAPA